MLYDESETAAFGNGRIRKLRIMPEADPKVFAAV
jgi:hypothetical protein